MFLELQFMEEDIFYNNIQKALENLPDDFNILEEKIDIEIQMQYFDFSKNNRTDELISECFEDKEQLFDPEIGTARKKEILSGMAAYNDVTAYRTIEKFVQNADGILKQWSILALQENRMLLQSSLLEEQQVFISTGLGGKGKKLRYFAVFINRKNDELLNKTQQKLLKNELIFELKNNEGEFEVIDFMEGFSTVQVMLPLKADLKQTFRNVIDECNQYGNFLLDDMIVTNVKVLSRGEIIQMLNQNKDQDFEELDEE